MWRTSRVVAFAAGLAAFATPVQADCPPNADPVSSQDMSTGLRDAIDHGLLWKVTRGGHSSYLYGTIHVAQRAWMFPGPQTLAALQASDGVALEIDPLDEDISARLWHAISRPANGPALPAALAERLQAAARAQCLDPATLASLRDEMAAITIEVMAARQVGLFASYGIDDFLSRLARQEHKPVRSLETPEAQARLLVSDDPAETARSVGEVLDELDDGQGLQTLARMAHDWERGDADDLADYARWCACLDTPRRRADFAQLVDERNPVMADRVAQWHAQGQSLFVAVGSLHMVGPNGIPALLRARGFVVERLAERAAGSPGLPRDR